MMHAYDEMYIEDAADNLGDMLDFAINDLHFEGGEFLDMFICSGMAKAFESGDPKYIAGMSGPELAEKIIQRERGMSVELVVEDVLYKTPEFWVGWALCQYQWVTCRSFSDILQVVPYDEVFGMYRTLHEADITKFFDVMNDLFAKRRQDIALRRFRKAVGLSQAQLAEMSGVSLRSIQMYEQKNKDINRASAITVARLSRAIGCRMESLLEY